MIEFTVENIGLSIGSRMIMPGSKLLLKSSPPTDWRRIGSATRENVGEKVLTPATPSAEQELEAVRARYEEVTGKKPHHKAKAETLLAEIEAEQ